MNLEEQANEIAEENSIASENTHSESHVRRSLQGGIQQPSSRIFDSQILRHDGFVDSMLNFLLSNNVIDPLNQNLLSVKNSNKL